MSRKKEVPEALPGLFPDTAEKKALRARDHVLIQKLAQSKARPLAYCGLAGVNAYDVERWRDSLDHVMVIERPINDRDLRSEFETRLLLKLTPLFNGNVELLFQDVWEYLVSAEFKGRTKFPDVINLDFCGGMINYVDMKYPVQREAFQGLFDAGRRGGASFLLILTLLPRDRGKVTYKKYLGDYVESLKQSIPAQDRKRLAEQLESNWRFHGRSNLALFKACLPLMLEDIGRAHNYRVNVAYIRLYTKMIHLVFVCEFVSGVLGIAPSFATAVKALNAPLRKLLPDGQEKQSWPPTIDGK